LRHFNNLTVNHNNFKEHDRYIKNIWKNNKLENRKFKYYQSGQFANMCKYKIKDLSFILRVL